MSPRVAADWFGAQTNCSTYNAHLVTVSSRSENSFLIREFITKQHKSRHFWIGLQRAPFDDSIWVWVDGSRLTFRDWYSGQPDNYRQEEYCGEMYVLYVRSGVVKWNDLNCSQASRFICEKGKPCCSFFFFLIVWISRDKLRNNDGRQGRKQDRLGAGILRGWENGRIVKKKSLFCVLWGGSN